MKIDHDHPNIPADSFRFAIVVSRWNASMTTKLVEGALEALHESGAVEDSISTFHVPGAFELPLACLKAAKTGKFDAVIALGVVIRGDTPHFEYVAGQAASGIQQASLSTGIPVLFGVITADTVEQVNVRTGERNHNKGYEAAYAAIEMISALRSIDVSSRLENIVSNVH